MLILPLQTTSHLKQPWKPLVLTKASPLLGTYPIKLVLFAISVIELIALLKLALIQATNPPLTNTCKMIVLINFMHSSIILNKVVNLVCKNLNPINNLIPVQSHDHNLIHVLLIISLFQFIHLTTLLLFSHYLNIHMAIVLLTVLAHGLLPLVA
jgi:hypothetical protein